MTCPAVLPSSVKCLLLLYADDSALMISDKDPRRYADRLGKELDSCRNWLIDNKLSVHLGKTESIIFGTKHKLKRVTSFSVKCAGTTIKPAKTVKYLGVTFDDSLTGQSIAQNILNKAGARLKFLFRHAGCLNQKTRKILCNALILCYFDYACSSWYTSLSQHFKNRLQTMQNKVVRFILNLGPRDHIGQEQRDKLGMLSVKDRVTQLNLNKVFKIFHGTSPTYLNSNFIRITSVHNHSTRVRPYNFKIPKIQNSADKTFFTVPSSNGIHFLMQSSKFQI